MSLNSQRVWQRKLIENFQSSLSSTITPTSFFNIAVLSNSKSPLNYFSFPSSLKCSTHFQVLSNTSHLRVRKDYLLPLIISFSCLHVGIMNPLDLNNLPDDHNRDRDNRDRENGKQIFDGEASSSLGHRKKKSGGKDGKDESGKVYECRFCSLKFCKSQALGGHMNRHRQERETELLNRARQLVFNNDNLAAPVPPHLGCCHPMAPAGRYPHQIGGSLAPSDPAALPLRFPARMFPNSSSTQLTPSPPPPPPSAAPPQPYLYPSHPPSRYASSSHNHNDYYVGHVLGGNTSNSTANYLSYGASGGQDHHRHQASNSNSGYSSYTCIGAPVSTEMSGSGGGGGSGGGAARDTSLNFSATQPPAPPSINRFQHGF